MDADRRAGPVNDADVDRELRSLLAVDPSPEFVARVRMRIANKPEPSQSSIAGLQLRTASAWWWPWKFVAAPILAAIVILIAVFASWPQPIEHVPTLAATALPNTTTFPPYVVSAFRRTGPAEAGRHISGPAEAARHVPGPAEAGRHVRGPVEAGHDVPGPVEAIPTEVVLDPRETAALRALILGIRKGDLDLEPVLRASVPSAMDLP